MAQHDLLRSRYIRDLILGVDPPSSAVVPPGTPRTLVQFWDDIATMPADVGACLDSWRALEAQGFRRILFDDERAARYIADHFGSRHRAAFRRCPHPAMRSDYFRLCFIVNEGGFYADADDTFLGVDCAFLLATGTLKVQPLCFDRSTGSMVPPDEFTNSENDSPDWTYYVNNNPLIAPAGHPVVRRALERATGLLLRGLEERPDIQSITGPGNLTASLVIHDAVTRSIDAPRDFSLLPGWEHIAVSTWPLGYRSDDRNWRLWMRLG